jgi:hypothetical protein
VGVVVCVWGGVFDGVGAGVGVGVHVRGRGVCVVSKQQFLSVPSAW